MNKEQFKLCLINQLSQSANLKSILLPRGFHYVIGQERYHKTVSYLYSKLGLCLQFDLCSFRYGTPSYQVSFRDVNMDDLSSEYSNLHDLTDILKREHYFEGIDWENGALCLYIYKCTFYITDDGLILRIKNGKEKVIEHDFSTGSNYYSETLANRWNTADYYHNLVWSDVYEVTCENHKTEENAQLVQEYLEFASKLKHSADKSIIMKTENFLLAQAKKKRKNNQRTV